MRTRTASADPSTAAGHDRRGGRVRATTRTRTERSSRPLLRRALAAGVVAAAFGAGIAATGEFPEPVELAAPETWNTYPNGLNERGEICGFRTEEGQPSRAIVWRTPDSEPEMLPLLDGDDLSWCGVINAKGVIPGRSGTRAVLWKRDNSIVDLSQDLPPSDRSAIWEISSRGVAAGQALLAGTPNFRAVVWSKKGKATLLPLDELVYHSTYAYGVNKKGLVAGAAVLLPAGRPYHAVYWTKRHKFVDLHPAVTEVIPTAVASVSQEMTDDGRVIGVAWDPVVGQDAPVQWAWVYDTRRDTMHVLDKLESGAATAWVSGGKNYIGGYLDGDWLFDSYAIGTNRAVLWTRTKSGRSVEWVPTTFDPPDGRDGFAIWDVDKKGAMIGVAGATGGTQRAYYIAPPRRKGGGR